MQTLTTVTDLTNILAEKRKSGSVIGFVPTMGALHQGHLALIEKARKENDLVVCSIFVNPLQFNNVTDLKLYPRNLEGDLELLRLSGCDIVFHPTYDEMYPHNEIPEIPDLGYLENVLEGAYRPGHFKGVAQVVKRFFEVIQPNRAYFGKKDYQQFLIIRNLVVELHLPVQVIGCETIRSEEGLAMSSRNLRLKPEERKAALLLIQSLREARKMFADYSLAEIKNKVSHWFQESPICKLEYFEIVDADTLLPLKETGKESRVIACVAAYVGEVRLIDNLILFP